MKHVTILLPLLLVCGLSSGCAREKRLEAAVIEKQAKIDQLVKQNKKLTGERQRIKQTNAYLRVQVKELQRTVKSTSGYRESLKAVSEREQVIEKAKRHVRQLNHTIKQKEMEAETAQRRADAAARQVEKLKEEMERVRSGRRGSR